MTRFASWGGLALALVGFLCADAAWSQAGSERPIGAPIRTVAAALPGTPTNTSQTYIVTDGLTLADCSAGGGSLLVHCAWTGAAWQALAGTGAGDMTKAVYDPGDDGTVNSADTATTATSATSATTATALAANGANCSAGQAPLGVDASGAAEGCATLATASTAGVTHPANTSDALAVGGTTSAAPLYFDPVPGLLKINVAGGGLDVTPAAPSAGTNVIRLDPNNAGTVGNAPAQSAYLYTELDGQAYVKGSSGAGAKLVDRDDETFLLASVATSNLAVDSVMTLASLASAGTGISLATDTVTISEPGTYSFAYSLNTKFDGTTGDNCFGAVMWNETDAASVPGVNAAIGEMTMLGVQQYQGSQPSGFGIATIASTKDFKLYSAACAGSTYPTTQTTGAGNSYLFVRRLK